MHIYILYSIQLYRDNKAMHDNACNLVLKHVDNFFIKKKLDKNI